MRYADAELLAWMHGLLAEVGAARAIRESAGLSKSAVGSVVKVTPQAVGRWERGERVPQGARALTYARLLQRLDAYQQKATP